MKKTIVCYGDSNTWGYTPGSGVRFDENTRWTGRLQMLLGEAYKIVECGMNARTTSFDDPFRDYLNGRHGLVYSLMEAKPVDLLIISLGTNDLKYGDAFRSSRGLDALLDLAVHANICIPGSSPIYREEPRVLVISPIALHPLLEEKFPLHEMAGRVQTSREFAPLFQDVCHKYGAAFLNAAEVSRASEADCVHMDQESHNALANSVKEKILQIFQEHPNPCKCTR